MKINQIKTVIKLHKNGTVLFMWSF